MDLEVNGVSPNPYQALTNSLPEGPPSTNPTYHWPAGQVKPRRSRQPNQVSQTPEHHPTQTTSPHVHLRSAQNGTCRGYFLPGCLGGIQVHCLVDSGCTLSVLSKARFNTLKPHVKDQLLAEEGVAHVADGSSTRTYGTIPSKGD